MVGKWSRKRTAVSLALALATVLAACSSSGGSGKGAKAAAQQVNVLVSATNTFEFLPAEYGLSLGVWSKRGLNPKNTYVSGGQWATTMASGHSDIGLASGEEVSPIEKGTPIKIVAPIGFDFRMMVLVVSAKSGIDSVSQLKGKTIGITSPGSLTDQLAQRLIQKQGWSANSVKLAAVGGADEQLAALSNGATDGFVYTAEVGLQAQAQGKAKVLMNFGSVVQNGVFQAIAASDSAIKNRSSVVQKYLDGWFEVVNYMVAHKSATVQFMAKKYNMPSDVASKVYDYDIDNISRDGVISPARVKGMAQYDVDRGMLKSVPPADTYYDAQFVPIKNS